MESVETVLETYGGPEEDWKDTYGVPKYESMSLEYEPKSL